MPLFLSTRSTTSSHLSYTNVCVASGVRFTTRRPRASYWFSTTRMPFDHTSLSLDEFKQLARQTLCTGELKLAYDEVAAIKQLEHEYLRQEFIMRM